MTTIYLLRHGAYHSPKPIVPYRLPGFHLSDEGIKQAQSRSETLKNVPIIAIFTSPMERTLETAKIIAMPHGLTPIIDERLNEVRSPLQGKTKAEIDKLGGWFVYENEWYKKQGGESLSEICSRVCACIDEKMKEYEGKTLVFISHGDNLMLAAEHFKGLSISLATLTDQSYVPMAGGYKIDFNNGKATIQSL